MSGWIPMLEQLFDGVLRGLGLELLRGGDPGDKGDVDETGVFAAQLLAHLADGFEEGQRLDVADGAADFDDGHVDVLRDLAHGVLDLVGDVRDDLDGLAEIVAAALLGDDLFVDAAGGEVVVAGEFGVGEALVVAEVEVGFGAVVGDEDFAVLEGRHGAGIDVEVGVELLQVDLEPAASSRQPMEAAARPLPKEDTTPPVTKMYFADIRASVYMDFLEVCTESRSPA